MRRRKKMRKQKENVGDAVVMAGHCKSSRGSS